MPTSNQVAPKAHSHSRMMSYSQCPLAFRLEYIDKVGTETSDAMEIGSAAHEFFDRFVKGKKFFSSTETDTFDQYVLLLAGECFQKDPRSQSNFKDCLAICQTFAKSYRPDSNYPNVTAEMKLAFNRNWKKCDWFAKDVMFRMKIDRIDMPETHNGDSPKKIRIVDYKTGFSGAINSFQLDTYALAASLIYPALEQVEVEFYYVQSGFKQKKSLEVKDLDVTKVQIEALISKMESDTKWIAKPGARCQNCPVAHACDEKPSDLVSIAKIEDAQTLGAEIAFLDAQAKAKKKVLKSWCEKQGPVESNGLVWNNYPIESLKVDVVPLLSLCAQHHVDPGEVLNPDSTALKKLYKKDPSFGEAIAPFTSMETSMRFYGKKGEKDSE